ncbi:MAG: MFS transporter [Candidatus Latescibacteria bacterium]|nr:MFS transporter [Candidatus Latescibacterota bacterium]
MRDKPFILGVINGAIFQVVVTIMQADLVLSAFVLKLTGSTLYAALPMALMHLGGLWPPLIVAHIAEGMERKKSIYILAGVARIATLACMGAATFWLAGSSSVWLVPAFLCLYFIYASANAAGGIGFMEMVAKTIPTTRRGSFMGWRGFFGGILGLGTGVYVQYMLGGGPDFPLNYAGLFFTASLCLIAAVFAYAIVEEPPSKIRRDRGAFGSHLRQGATTLRRDRNYRLLVGTRLLLTTAMAGQVVFIPYAIKELALPESIVGVLMVLTACFTLPSNFLWSHLSDRYGNRRLLLVSTAVFLLSPLCAVASHYAPGRGLGLPLPAEYDAKAVLFVLAYILGATATRGGFMGTTNYLLEIAPEESRPTYMAFMRILQAPTVLLPLLAGMVAEFFSFQVAFVAAGVASLGTCYLVSRLDEPRR